MSSDDIESMMQWYEKKGLTLTEKRNVKKYWNDTSVITLPFGETYYPCNWIKISDDVRPAEFALLK